MTPTLVARAIAAYVRRQPFAHLDGVPAELAAKWSDLQAYSIETLTENDIRELVEDYTREKGGEA